MAVDRTYRCDLCRDVLSLEHMSSGRRAVGIYWQDWPKPSGWLVKPAREVERHLCVRCVSSIQAMPAVCGQGFDCNGGPGCGSDHK
jgi:hypothetical protein